MFGWTIDEPTSFRLLDAFVAAGFNLIDTADVYSRWAPGNQGGESETILGRWLKQGGKRDQVVIATKVGMEMGPDKKGLSRAYILQAVEDSLRRLQTDHIDLYQSHKDDPETPLEETLGAFGDLIRQGKVRAIGASNYSAERLVRGAPAQPRRAACPATSASSRTTTSASGPGSRRAWSRSAARRGSASSPTTRWPAGS